MEGKTIFERRLGEYLRIDVKGGRDSTFNMETDFLSVKSHGTPFYLAYMHCKNSILCFLFFNMFIIVFGHCMK